MIEKYLELIEGEKKDEVVLWTSTVLKNYLKKQPENRIEIEHILDYLKSNKSPSRLKKMSYDQAKRKADEWNKSLQKKGKDLVETEEDVEDFLIKDDYRIVKLKSKNSYQREGNLMSHCVASYYGKKEVEIYSLRDNKNEPHCTIEIQKNKDKKYINQIKGKGNSLVSPKYINPVLDFLKLLNHDIREIELKQLGYQYMTMEEYEFLEKNVKGISWLDIGNKKYMYMMSNVEKK